MMCRASELESSMKDENLIREFIRVSSSPDGILFEVRRIGWEGSHTPRSTWVSAALLPVGSSESDIDGQCRTLLQQPEHFRVCVECSERNPGGWMHDDRICQACAERNYGVVY